MYFTHHTIDIHILGDLQILDVMILEMSQACIRMHWLTVVQLLSHLPCYNNDIHFTIIRAFWGISLLSNLHNPINPAGMETLASRVGRFESELEALRREAMVGLEGGKSWNPRMMLVRTI